jgi:3-isopropylmalate dehydrogenase
MIEPVHGTAPDIAGQGNADPTATIQTVEKLLDHVGRTAAAARVESAAAADLVSRSTGGPRSTAEIGDAIAGRLT